MSELDDRTKTCCGGHYPMDALFCVECRQALEETHYRAWIVLTLAGAASIEWLFAHAGVLKKFVWPEVLMMESLLLLVAYPLAKLVQKLRNPSRAVLREMGSVFADRWSRVLILSAWAFIAYVAWRGPRIASSPSNLVDPADAALRASLIKTSLVGFGVASVLIVLDQGLSFFDLRERNTYVAQGRD